MCIPIPITYSTEAGTQDSVRARQAFCQQSLIPSTKNNIAYFFVLQKILCSWGWPWTSDLPCSSTWVLGCQEPNTRLCLCGCRDLISGTSCMWEKQSSNWATSTMVRFYFHGFYVSHFVTSQEGSGCGVEVARGMSWSDHCHMHIKSCLQEALVWTWRKDSCGKSVIMTGWQPLSFCGWSWKHIRQLKHKQTVLARVTESLHG